MSKLRSLIKKNITEIPYEGQEIDVDGIVELIKNLLKGMITETSKYSLTTKGYIQDDVYYSREEIVNKFLNRL